MVRAAAAVLFFALLLFAVTPFGLAYVYLRHWGAAVPGEVVAKREYIRMPGAEAWERVFEVEYRFRPADSGRPESRSEQVAQALYDSVQPGSPVEVRCAPPRIRSLHIRYVGSILAANTWAARLPGESDDRRNLLEIGAIALMFLIGYLAYSRNSRPLGALATFVAAAVCSAVLPFGGFVAVLLLLSLRKRPAFGNGYAFAAAAGLVVGVWGVYLRLPRPDPPIEGPPEQATAIVRNVREVDHIWQIRRRSSGQSLRTPFEMVDLDVAGVHALDRVDPASVPNLAKGAAVPVVYPAGNARAARIEGATRTYADDAFRYVLEFEYGIGIPLGFVLFFLITLPEKLVRWFARRATGVQ